jgi:hypothetical protein
MKRLLISIFFFFIFFYSFGQLKGGIKGGVNFCSFIVAKSGDLFTDETFNPRVSYHIGTYVQNSFSDQLAWQIEVLFSNKGYIHKVDDESINVSLNYLNWPVLLIYKPIKLLEFEVGPEFGYLISGEDFLSSFDLGIDLGARFNISNKFNAGLRYCQGLPFKMKLSGPEANGYDPTYQNGVFQIYVGFNLINEPASE